MKNIENGKLNGMNLIAFGGAGDSNLSTFSGSSSCVPNANATACQPISSPGCDALAALLNGPAKIASGLGIPVVPTYIGMWADNVGSSCTNAVNVYNNAVNRSSIAIWRNN